MGRKIKNLVKSLDKDLNSYDLKAQGYKQVKEFGYISTDPDKLITQEQINAAGYSTPQYTIPKSGKLVDSGISAFRKEYKDARAELIKTVTDKGRKEENGFVAYKKEYGVDVNVGNSFTAGFHVRWIDFVIEGVVLQETGDKNKSYTADDAERKQFLDKLSKMVELGGGQYWFDAFMVFADRYYLKSSDLKNYSMNKPGISKYNNYLTEQGKARNIDVAEYLVDEANVTMGQTMDLQTDEVKKFDNLLKFEFYILNDGPKSATSDNASGLLKRMDNGYLEHLEFFVETFPKDNTERYELLYEAFLDAGDDYKGPYTDQIINPSQAKKEVIVTELEEDEKTKALKTDCEMKKFGFNSIGQKGSIDKDLKVVVDVPIGTDVKALVADFKLSKGATASVGSTVQVSGTTVNNFTNPLGYKVTAEDGVTSKLYVVTVRVEQPENTPVKLPLGSYTFEFEDEDRMRVVGPSGSKVTWFDCTVEDDLGPLTLVPENDEEMQERKELLQDTYFTELEFEGRDAIDNEYVETTTVQRQLVEYEYVGEDANGKPILKELFKLRGDFPLNPVDGQIFITGETDQNGVPKDYQYDAQFGNWTTVYLQATVNAEGKRIYD